MANDKERNKLKLSFLLITLTRRKYLYIFEILVTLTRRKEKVQQFLSLSFVILIRRKKLFEDNFYINNHELINNSISADGHPITFV